MIYSTTARVSGWGSQPWARSITHLTREEKAAIAAGVEVRLADRPAGWDGKGWTTDRRVIAGARGRYYTRVPSA